MHPVIKELRITIENNPVMIKLMNSMVVEVKKSRKTSPVRNIRQLLLILNHVLTVAPTYEDPGPNGEIRINSIPLAAAFGEYASTQAGRELFSRADITQVFAKYLDAYREFLDSKESTKVLYDKPNGWMVNEGAKQFMQMEDYIEPKDGYPNWNAYFSRHLKPGARPISQPDNDEIVACPIDGIIYNLQHNVQEFSKFWIKRQPYSLNALLNSNDKYVKQFIGGSVWQAFLDPYNYHRWHTPVSGEVIDIIQVGGLNPSSENDLLQSQGLYYSILRWPGFGEFSDWTGSLPYMAMLNRRAIIYVKNETVGLVAIIPVGMLEVSSILITVKKGDKLKKGDELGCFQYGGSTFALVFQKDKIRNFTILPPQNIEESQLPLLMGEKIAVANPIK